MPKIYTKAGDKGFTRKYTGEKISKSSETCDAVGQTDIINVSIGQFKALLKKFRSELTDKYDATNNSSETLRVLNNIINDQERIQRLFLNIASEIASTPKPGKVQYFGPEDDNTNTSLLESKIDKMTEILPELTVFILMGENELSTSAHRCRVDVREFERMIVGSKDFNIPYTFVNRLSDYYFQLARYVDYLQAQEDDTITKKSYKWWSECFDVMFSCMSHTVCIYIGSQLFIQ